MTKRDFDALPMLIRRKDVKSITGWCDRTFKRKIEKGEVKAERVNIRCRYHKSSLAHFCQCPV